jgi:hypothetical protein
MVCAKWISRKEERVFKTVKTNNVDKINISKRILKEQHQK